MRCITCILRYLGISATTGKFVHECVVCREWQER